jgi:hypothetical protein
VGPAERKRACGGLDIQHHERRTAAILGLLAAHMAACGRGDRRGENRCCAGVGGAGAGELAGVVGLAVYAWEEEAAVEC